MPVTKTTTITTSHSSGVAVHNLSWRGMAGWIFLLLVLATVLYVVGFATTAWYIYEGRDARGNTVTSEKGLWKQCVCGTVSGPEWMTATQAMITIGLIGLIIALILISVYMCVHSISKNTTILALVIVCFVAVLFMVIGFVIFGVKHDQQGRIAHISWSFGVSVAGTIVCFIAGILAVVQMRQSGV